MDETILLKRAQRGDRDAFGELVMLYQGRLRGYAARFVESAADAYDLAQDAFLDAWAKLGSFEPGREFYPWLRAICRHRILNYFRSRRVRRTAGQAVVDAAVEQVFDTRGEPEDAPERVVALRLCLDALSPTDRELLGLRYARNVAVKEIAEQLRRTAAAVSMHLMRLREALSACVERRLRTAEL